MAQPTSAATLYGSGGIVDVFKEIFPDPVLEDLSMKDRDLFKWLPKADDLDGDGIHVPMIYAKPQGALSRFAGMQASHSESKTEKAFITRNPYYSGLSIDAEAMKASRKNRGAFFDVKAREMEMIVQQHVEEIEKALWGDALGEQGVISGTPSTTTVTLATPENIVNFAEDMWVAAYPDSGFSAGTSTVNSTVAQVVSVNYDAGTMVMSADVQSAGWADGYHLVRSSNASSSTDYNNLLHGLASWIPETAETSGTFLQMDRTKDIVRLQGFRQAFVGTIEETVKKICTKAARLSAKYDTGWLSHGNWNRFEIELAARALRDEGSAQSFGIPALVYKSSRGLVRFNAGTFCPEDVGYILYRPTWMLHHMCGLPHIVDDDGLTAIRANAFDGIEIRVRSWCELSNSGPKHNARFAIS